ncbi:MAG: SusC/RagA family TonB-linked outer membrane protein [Flavobacteriaceae bacterium]|nr:SusC/RagA family TonB-linked outer membrane protein [Flavobacteriaceae bacterium]
MRTKFSGILTLLLAFVVQLTFAQEKTISGTISDENSLPLPGVNVIIKGTSTGTQSDFDGNYSVNASVGQTIVYSYLGYTTQEQAVTAGTSNISFSMAPDAEALSEVVVTGYGGRTKSKKALGYAVSTIEAEAIENKPESDVIRSLNGKVAGVQIVGTGGATGSGTNFIIRSKSSINGNNQPLFVVDGVPFDASTNQQTGFGGGNTVTSSRFLDLDPNNIESVQILKGLSAAVLYGQQGRNGVVLIKTKTGSSKDLNKKFEVTLSQSVYVTKISALAEYQNDYGQGANNAPNAGFVGNWGGRFDAGLDIAHPYAGLGDAESNPFPQFVDVEIPYSAAPNNVSDFFRTGIGSSTSINVAGSGDGGSRYNMNFGYTTEDGYIPNNGLTRYNFGIGGSAKLSNKFTFNGTANYSNLRVNTPPIAANNAANSLSIFTRLLFIPRNVDLGNLPFENPSDGSSVYYRADQENPYWLLKNAGTEQKVSRFYGSYNVSYDVSDFIRLNYRFGLDTYNEVQDFKVNRGAVTTNYITGYLRSTSATNLIHDHNFNAGFNNIKISEKLTFSTSLGFNARRDSYEQFGISSTDQITFGFFNHKNFLNGGDLDAVRGSSLSFEQEQNILGIYNETSLDYDNFLFLTLSGRNDWASTLEQQNRSLFYPGVSLYFVATSLDGIGSNSGGLGYLKFRAAYGTSARFPSPYSTRDVLLLQQNGFIDSDGPIVTNSVDSERFNTDLKPELQREFEVGSDAEFFNRRLVIEATVYKRFIEDQIIQNPGRPVNPSTGFTSIADNIAKSEIQGVELGLNFVPIKAGDFTWSIRNNFSAYENTVTDTGDIEEPILFAGFIGLGNYAVEGKPLGVIIGSYAARIDSNNATEENPFGIGVEGTLLINPTDGKVIVSDNDLGLGDEIVGDPNPDWNATSIHTFEYRGLSLSAQIEYQHGGDIYSQTASQFYRRGVTTVNTDNREGSFVLPGVLADPTTGTPLTDGSGNQIPNTIQISANDVYFINLVDPVGQGIYDASHFRLREISLGYTLPEKFLEKTPFGKVSFSFSGQNLYVRTFNIPQAFNIDPEALSSGVGNGQGLEFQTGPTSKRYSFSVKATF